MNRSRLSNLTVARERPIGPRRSVRRGAAVLLTGVAGALFLAAAIAWWQERPLGAAERELEAGRPRVALRAADEFLRSRPRHSRASVLRARALVELGRYHEAVELFEEHGAATPQESHAFARGLLALGRWESARPLLERYVRLNPEDADALHELTACYAKLGKSREALATAVEFSKRPGQAARGHVLIGTIHRDFENKRQAAEAYRKVLDLEPEAENLQVAPAEFLHAYGAVLLDLGEPEEAASLIEKGIARGPASAAYSDLGRALEQLGRTEEAERAWRSALALDPEDQPSREGLASAALGRRDGRAAIELLGPLLDAPTSSTAYLLQRAYSIVNDPQKAAEWQARANGLRAEERLRSTVDRVLRDAPDSAWAAVLRAYRSAEQGRWEEAEQQMTQADTDESFVTSLRDAIRRRGDLPPLSDLPIGQF